MKKLTIFVITLVLFSNILAMYYIFQSITHPYKYHEEIIYYARKYEIDASLLASIINVESHYDKDAMSNKGAIGLGQILPSTAKYMNEFYHLNEPTIDLLDANTNIKYTSIYLKYLYQKFHDTRKVLASYNAGETVVRSWLNSDKNLENIPYKETNDYVTKINKNLHYYSRIYQSV